VTYYLDTLGKALRDGACLHAFLSGGGLRVVCLERPMGTLVGYGEHPQLCDALSHAAEDYLAGGRPYKEVYGGSKPHYLTGSTTPNDDFDAWIRRGQTMDARCDDSAIVVELHGYDHQETPKEVGTRLRAGETVRWEARGYQFESTPFRFNNDEVGWSTKTLKSPPGRRDIDAMHYKITKTGRADSLATAMDAALAAEPAEVIT